MMDRGINCGYTITDQIQVGNKVFVIGENANAPNRFVTWQGYADKPDAYDFGHYFNSRLKALEHLCKRASDEISSIKSYEKQVSKKKHEPER